MKNGKLLVEVKKMSKHSANRGQAAPGVNPQGYGQGAGAASPKSKLENKAKRDNTKR